VMNSPRCSAAQNTCTSSLTMCLKNLATNTLIPIGVATTASTRGCHTVHRFEERASRAK
jgi:hypothetical protein